MKIRTMFMSKEDFAAAKANRERQHITRPDGCQLTEKSRKALRKITREKNGK